MTLPQFKQQVRERFRKEYRNAYKGILSDEVLSEGNPWFESFLDSIATEAWEMGAEETMIEVNETLAKQNLTPNQLT